MSGYKKSFKKYTTTIQRLVEQLSGYEDLCEEAKAYFELYKKVDEEKGLEEITDSSATKKEVQNDLMKSLADGLEIAINVINKNTGPKKLTKATNETEKLFSIWSSFVETESSTTKSDKVLKSILSDEKAFEFWNKCLPVYGVNKLVPVSKFNYILSKEYPDKTFLKTDVSDACLKISPYTLRTVVDYCGGWDNFIDACQVGNPFRALVCTNSRATATCDKTVMNPTDTKKFYRDSTTVGQAPYGSFFILLQADCRADKGSMEGWVMLGSVSNSLAAAIVPRPASEAFPEAWVFESSGRIRLWQGSTLPGTRKVMRLSFVTQSAMAERGCILGGGSHRVSFTAGMTRAAAAKLGVSGSSTMMMGMAT